MDRSGRCEFGGLAEWLEATVSVNIGAELCAFPIAAFWR